MKDVPITNNSQIDKENMISEGGERDYLIAKLIRIKASRMRMIGEQEMNA